MVILSICGVDRKITMKFRKHGLWINGFVSKIYALAGNEKKF